MEAQEVAGAFLLGVEGACRVFGLNLFEQVFVVLLLFQIDHQVQFQLKVGGVVFGDFFLGEDLQGFQSLFVVFHSGLQKSQPERRLSGVLFVRLPDKFQSFLMMGEGTTQILPVLTGNSSQCVIVGGMGVDRSGSFIGLEPLSPNV